MHRARRHKTAPGGSNASHQTTQNGPRRQQCIAPDDTKRPQSADWLALAKTLALQGTPAFIVGDTLVPGADIAALKLAIEQARAGAAKPG